MKQFERIKDKLALVGFASTTRHMAPFDDDSYEIWTVNEAGNIFNPAFSWVKRFDRLFQLHPRWDFTRRNNLNDPNHFAWLQNKPAPCVMCEATGKVTNIKSKETSPCPACKDGVYTPPENRSRVQHIYMQEAHPDIPNSVKYPLEQMVKMNPFGKYFESSVSYMTMLAAAMQYKEIYVVGFEMSAQSEYFYQRANFECLCGVLRERGANIVLPQQTNMFKAPLYGYENMKTGYRQQLDMRIAVLDASIEEHNMELMKLEGGLNAWKSLLPVNPLTAEGQEQFQSLQAKYGKMLGLVNLEKGARYETENLRSLYDSYFMGNVEDSRKDTDQYVKTIYGTE